MPRPQASPATNLDSTLAWGARLATARTTSGGKDSSMKRTSPFPVLNVAMKRPKPRISACRVSRTVFFWLCCYEMWIIRLNTLLMFVARSHKFGRQNQAGNYDSDEEGDGYGYYGKVYQFLNFHSLLYWHFFGFMFSQVGLLIVMELKRTTTTMTKKTIALEMKTTRMTTRTKALATRRRTLLNQTQKLMIKLIRKTAVSCSCLNRLCCVVILSVKILSVGKGTIFNVTFWNEKFAFTRAYHYWTTEWNISSLVIINGVLFLWISPTSSIYVPATKLYIFHNDMLIAEFRKMKYLLQSLLKFWKCIKQIYVFNRKNKKHYIVFSHYESYLKPISNPWLKFLV